MRLELDAWHHSLGATYLTEVHLGVSSPVCVSDGHPCC